MTESKLIPSVVHQSQNFFIPGPKNHSIEHKKLPVGTYLVDISPSGFICELVDDLKLPRKLYGNIISRAARIAMTFQQRSGTTGVLTHGPKGSGKSLLVKAVSQLMLGENIPTLIVNKPFYGDMFAQFLISLNTPVVVLLDEFEKVYSAENQEKLLTLLDGTFNVKCLFLLTCNRVHKIDDNFINRPSRIYYNLPYKGMEVDAIHELALDTLKDKTRVNDVIKLSAVFDDEMNFDMVQATVEEINRYPDQPLEELMAMMNLRPQSLGGSVYYTASIKVGDKTYSGDNLWSREICTSIFTFSNLEFYVRTDFSDEDLATRQERGISEEAAATEKTFDIQPKAAPTNLTFAVGGVRYPNKKSKLGVMGDPDEAARSQKFDKQRPVLGKDYDEVWSEWIEDYKFYGDQEGISKLSFSAKQMARSDVRNGRYEFQCEGATLFLNKIESRTLDTADYYKRLG